MLAHPLPRHSFSQSRWVRCQPTFEVLLLLSALLLPLVGVNSYALTKAQLLRATKQDSAATRRLGKRCRKAAVVRNPRSQCDLDGDGLTNYREFRLRTNMRKVDTDGDGLSDWVEVMVYGTSPRKRDSDGDGRSDGQEVLIDGTNPLLVDTVRATPTPSGGGCDALNFDAEGNTVAFGIPAPVVGNIARGNALYGTANCAICHPLRDHGVNMGYAQLRAKVTAPPMNITNLSNAQFADLVAYLNQSQRGGGNCATPTPTPLATPPQPSPTATPTPQAEATPCVGQNFDSSGNTTPGAFDIPAPLSGNVAVGTTAYNNTCGMGGCHGSVLRGQGLNFPTLKSRITSPPMTLTIQDDRIAHLVAFLNQSSLGGCTEPAPTPTPVSDTVAGSWVYQSSCAGCHPLNRQGVPPSDQRNISLRQLREAIAEKREMRDIVLSGEQERVLIIYLGSF